MDYPMRSARIFHYVPKIKPCPASPRSRATQDTKHPPFTIDPLIISHVCSRWRQTAIHTSVLWSHIDLQPDLDQADIPRSIARLETFIERSGQILLNIHILDPIFNLNPFDISINEHDSYLQPYIELIAPRTKSLTLESSSGLDDGKHPHATLAAFFAKCVPGTLKTLTIEIPVSRPSSSQWLPHPSIQDQATFSLPVDNIESLFCSITTLRLCGYYPQADSQAYHGLIELRLHSYRSNEITESALISALRSSPRLQVFYFTFKITDPLPENALITPVHPDDLEVFGWSLTNQEQIGNLLRWLYPGSKPLSVSMSSPFTLSAPRTFVAKDETEKFLARSRVTKLCLYSIEGYLLTEVLKLAPHVRILAIAGMRGGVEDAQASQTPAPIVPQVPSNTWSLGWSWSGTRNLPTLNVPILGDSKASELQHPLDSLYIVRSFFAPSPKWNTIRELVRKHRVRRLTLWSFDSHYYENGGHMKCVPPDDLYTVCPVVNIIPVGEPNPVEDWC
ncbi:hypothetical protein ACGC1H_003185 [Rhizoctonia solani]